MEGISNTEKIRKIYSVLEGKREEGLGYSFESQKFGVGLEGHRGQSLEMNPQAFLQSRQE
jgi:hypothetical protein